MTLAPGTTLGRYQILKPLGSGGMATVYKAYEPSLDRTVALKVIRPGLAEEEGFLARFRREAQAVAKLSHPNIVHVLTFDEVDGRFFLAMDYLEGGTLKDRLSALSAGTLLEPHETASIITQVADALAYAHEQGIVHRDIKPSNIMLAGRGRAIVTDFGIAKIVSAAQLTQTGVGIGTPEYMSPEQGAGGQVDAGADIYSLGVVAYELLVGRVPYLADTPFAIVAAHMRDPLPLPTSINPAIGPATERALLKALAKQPDQRFATATEFATALSDGLRGAPAGATMPTLIPARAKPDTRSFTFALPALPHSRPALLAIAAAVLLVVAGTGALVSGSFRRTEATPIPNLASAPTGGAAPKFAVPAKGTLFWEAKLDGTDVDMRGTRGLGSNTDATMSDLKFVPGAIEYAILKLQGATAFALNSPARETFVAEVDVDARADKGGFLDFQWWGPNPRYDLAVDTKAGRMTLHFLNPGTGTAPPVSEPLTSNTPAAEVYSGGTFTLAVVVERTRFTAYANQRQVVQVASDSRVAPAAVPLTLFFRGDIGTLRITGIRLYELPAGAVASSGPTAPTSAAPPAGPSFDSLHSAAFYEAKFDGVAADLSNFSPADRVKVGSGQLTMTATDVPVGMSTSATPQTSPAVQYAMDMTVQFTPGSEGRFSTCIRRTLTQGTTTFPSPGATYCLVLTTTPEVLELTYAEPTGTGTTRSETIGGAITAPGARTRAIHLAIVVDRQTFTVFVDDMSKPAMVRTDPRLMIPTSPVGFLVSRLQTNPNTGATVTVRDLKLYRLA